MRQETRWYAEHADGTRTLLELREASVPWHQLTRVLRGAGALVREVVECPEPADREAWQQRLREAVGAWIRATDALDALGYTLAADAGGVAGRAAIEAEDALRAAYDESEPQERVVSSTREALA